MSVRALTYTVEVHSGTWVTIDPNAIIAVDIQQQISGNDGLPIAFGEDTDTSATITAVATAWTAFLDRIPIRITYTINGTTSQQVFHGVAKERSRTLDEVSIKCAGLKDLMNTRRGYSPMFYRRPVATATSVTSVEDPTVSTYAGGLINWILWQAGARPAAQDASYPDAAFYYECDEAILAPDWSWVAGEPGWDEMLKLARASGGQVYQSSDGVIRYKQPLSFASGSATITLDESVYATLEETIPTDQYATRVVASYTPRIARATQEVLSDTTPRLIEAGAGLVFSLEPQYPLKSLEGTFDSSGTGSVDQTCFTVNYFDGTPVPYSGSGYTVAVSYLAQKITFGVQNWTARPILLNRITLRGEPVTAGETGNVTLGPAITTDGQAERTIEDSVYVQSKAHATRLANLTLALYGSARAVRTAGGCPYNPNITLGDTVYLTSSTFGLSAARHLVTDISTSDTGGETTYRLLDLAGLPATSEYYIVGTNHSGQTKKLGF